MAERFTFPQTGDNDDAEHFGSLIGQANLSDYVETGLTLQNYNAAGPDIDVTTGKCYISQISETASSSGDTILSTNSVVQVPATSALALTDSAVNEIYVDPDFGTDDNGSVEATTTGIPANGLKIGEVDTSADTVDGDFNRQPNITIESIDDNDGNDIYIKGSGGAVEDSKRYDGLAPSDGGDGDVLTTDGTSTSWTTKTTDVTQTREAAEFIEAGVTVDGLTVTDRQVEAGGLDDISTASFESSYDISAQTTLPEGMHVTADGLKMYVTDGDVFEYTLSTAHDVTTASFVQSAAPSEDASMTDIEVVDGGEKMFLLGGSNDNLYEYTLGTPYDISSRSFVQSFNVGAQDDGPNGFQFSERGREFIFAGSGTGNNNVFKYILQDKYDLTSVQTDGSFDASAQISGTLQGVFVNYDWSRAYVQEQNGDVHEYTFGTNFDMSTASFNQTFSDTTNTDNPLGFYISREGQKMYFADNNTDSVTQYSITTSESGTVEFDEPSVLKEWIAADYIASDSSVTVNLTDGSGGILVPDINAGESISQVSDSTIAYQIDFSSAPDGANLSWLADTYIGTKLPQKFGDWRSGWGSGTNDYDHPITVQGQGRDNSAFEVNVRAFVDGVVVDSNWADASTTAYVSAEVPPGSTYNISVSADNPAGVTYRERDMRY